MKIKNQAAYDKAQAKRKARRPRTWKLVKAGKWRLDNGVVKEGWVNAKGLISMN